MYMHERVLRRLDPYTAARAHLLTPIARGCLIQVSFSAATATAPTHSAHFSNPISNESGNTSNELLTLPVSNPCVFARHSLVLFSR
jgi:hypothetical protein